MPSATCQAERPPSQSQSARRSRSRTGTDALHMGAKWSARGRRRCTPPPSAANQATPHRKAAAQPAAPTRLPAGALPCAPRVEQRRHHAGLPSGGARLVMHRGQAVPKCALLQRRVPRGAPVQLPQRDALQAQPPQRAPALRARRGAGSRPRAQAMWAVRPVSAQQASRGTALMAFAAPLITWTSRATLAHTGLACVPASSCLRNQAGSAPHASRHAVRARTAGARGVRRAGAAGAHRTALTNWPGVRRQG